jgi:hypothetical protein
VPQKDDVKRKIDYESKSHIDGKLNPMEKPFVIVLGGNKRLGR